MAAPVLMASSLSSGLGPYDLAASVPRHSAAHMATAAAQSQARATPLAAALSGGGGAPSPLSWALLTCAEFEAKNGCKAPAGKRYFAHTQLADIIAAYPLRQGLKVGA